MKTYIVPLLLTLVLTSGCMSISGLENSSSKFACKAPPGMVCTSVSGIYANAEQNNLPALQGRAHSGLSNFAPPSGAAAFPSMRAGTAIRSNARMLRIWVAPWVDDEGTLHDQSYMYVMVDHGKWLVEKSRESTVKRSLAHLRMIARARAAVGAQQAGASKTIIEPATGEAEK